MPVEAARLMECVQHATLVVPQRLITIEAVLHAHAQRVAEAAETLRRTGRVERKRARSEAEGDAAALVNI